MIQLYLFLRFIVTKNQINFELAKGLSYQFQHMMILGSSLTKLSKELG